MPEDMNITEDTLDEVETSRDESMSQQELPNTVQPERKVLDLDQVKAGFLVGIDAEGEWIWQTFGQQSTLDSLIGCLYHAKRQLSLIYDNNTARGERRVHEVGMAVVQMGEQILGKIDQVLEAAGVKQRRGTDV